MARYSKLFRYHYHFNHRHILDFQNTRKKLSCPGDIVSSIPKILKSKENENEPKQKITEQLEYGKRQPAKTNDNNGVGKTR